jgi:transcriptional regulator with XRE-family HTH domain
MTTPPVDASLLERPDLQAALLEHDFAAAFTLIRKYGGLSQNRIAAACQLTPGKVSTIIKGTHQVTSYAVIARIADGLRIPGAMVGLANRPWEQPEPAETSPRTTAAAPSHSDSLPWTASTTQGIAARMTRTDLQMDRRAATRSIASLAVGATLLNSLEGWLHPVGDASGRRLGRLGQRQVTQLEEAARTMRQWNRHRGGSLLRRAVLGQLAEVTDLVKEPQAEDIAQRLYNVMADLASTAASMSWDSGMERPAQDYYRLALRAAHTGGDRMLGANILAGMARQMLCRDPARPQDALELVRFAQEGADASPRVRAMLHTREAWAYAASGRIGAFHRANGLAAEALSEACGEEPYWISYFDQAELAGVTGNRLLEVARRDARYAEDAAQEIQKAVEARGIEAGRGHALDLVGLAECSWLLGDVRAALNRTHRAVDAAEDTQSTRVRAKLRNLSADTMGRHAASAPVREARQRIHQLLSA